MNEHDIYYENEQDHWWFYARREIISSFLEKIKDLRKDTVIEFGCGTGFNLKTIFSKFQRKIGVDLNQDALNYAQIYGLETYNGDANNFNKVKQVNVIAFLDVLFHKNIYPDEALQNAHRILKSNGYVIVFDGAFDILAGKHNAKVESTRRFKRKNLIRLFKRNNFQVEYINYWGMSLFIILFIKRFIIENLFHRENENYDITFFMNDQMKILMKFESFLSSILWVPFGASIIAIGKKI